MTTRSLIGTVGGARNAGLLTALTGTVALWCRRLRERQQLAALEPRMLRDIGLNEATRLNECDKPFWRA